MEWKSWVLYQNTHTPSLWIGSLRIARFRAIRTRTLWISMAWLTVWRGCTKFSGFDRGNLQKPVKEVLTDLDLEYKLQVYFKLLHYRLSLSKCRQNERFLIRKHLFPSEMGKRINNSRSRQCQWSQQWKWSALERDYFLIFVLFKTSTLPPFIDLWIPFDPNRPILKHKPKLCPSLYFSTTVLFLLFVDNRVRLRRSLEIKLLTNVQKSHHAITPQASIIVLARNIQCSMI